jgi:hypothetical protein
MAERIKELTAENGRLKGRHGRRAYEERIQQAEAALREVIKEAHDNPAGQSKEMHDILAKYKESGDVDIDDANVSDHEAGRDRLDYQPDEENSDDK